MNLREKKKHINSNSIGRVSTRVDGGLGRWRYAFLVLLDVLRIVSCVYLWFACLCVCALLRFCERVFFEAAKTVSRCVKSLGAIDPRPTTRQKVWFGNFLDQIPNLVICVCMCVSTLNSSHPAPDSDMLNGRALERVQTGYCIYVHTSMTDFLLFTYVS